MTLTNPFYENVRSLNDEIQQACARVNRDSAAIRVIGVTKTVDATAVDPLIHAGLTDFGENRWQQARDKVSLPVAQQATWHFIGRLQSNKVKYVVPNFDWVHSVDSLSLAQELSRRAEKQGKIINCLIQVNASGELSKAGIEPQEVIGLIQAVRGLPGISVRGLMTMAPHYGDVEKTRSTFVRVRECLNEARDRLVYPELQELSMGMSNDFSVAIEEGATMIRIGRRLVAGWVNAEE